MMDLDNIPDTQTEAEELEEVVMGLIINSGQARSLAYAALKQAKQGDFAAAKAMMDQSRMALNEAHLVQTKLIDKIVTVIETALKCYISDRLISLKKEPARIFNSYINYIFFKSKTCYSLKLLR